MYSFPSSPPLRSEIQNYLRSCEHLLSVPAAPNNLPFTKDELLIVNYYVGELTKMIGSVAKV